MSCWLKSYQIMWLLLLLLLLGSPLTTTTHINFGIFFHHLKVFRIPHLLIFIYIVILARIHENIFNFSSILVNEIDRHLFLVYFIKISLSFERLVFNNIPTFPFIKPTSLLDYLIFLSNTLFIIFSDFFTPALLQPPLSFGIRE